MTFKVLVTGGAGFIGSFLVDGLLSEGHDVRVLDNLEPQVHPSGIIPDYLNKGVEFLKGDIRNKADVKKALEDVDVVLHHAARVGVGQSMYQVHDYVDVNVSGTALIMDEIINSNLNIKKFIVAASMSSYGEGTYSCSMCGLVEPPLRGEAQLSEGEWNPKCPNCGAVLEAVPTKESKVQVGHSVYAQTKKVQEDLVLSLGKTYGIPSVALRYFNAYGPRQSLSNPYNGIAAIFLSRIKNDNRPLIFEDGLQSRDFIHINDIVKANILAMNHSSADYEVFNVGSGSPTSIINVAEILASVSGKDIRPLIAGEFRKNDVRHCYADLSKIKSKLGFEPSIGFDEGVKDFVSWSSGVESIDMVEKATQELKERGLI